MKDLLKDPVFWTGLFTFLTAFMVTLRKVISRISAFIYALQKKKTEDAMSVEALKKEYSVTLLGQLKATVDKLEPEVRMLKESAANVQALNSKMITELMENQSKLLTLLNQTTEIVQDVKRYFHESIERVEKAKAGGLMVVERLDKMETKVEKFGQVIVAMGKKIK